MTATPEQIRKIHALARNAQLDEEMRRDLMEREVNCRSTKDMTPAQAIKVIDRLKVIAGDRAKPVARKGPPKARGALDLKGPFVGVVRALWISGWHLGVMRDRTDAALAAFVKRQTGIDHMSWVRDPADSRRVIEALKRWLARDAGVDWPAEDTDGHGRKLAVYLALRRRLTAAGVDPQFVEYPGRVGAAPLADNALDHLTRSGGERLRQARKG